MSGLRMGVTGTCLQTSTDVYRQASSCSLQMGVSEDLGPLTLQAIHAPAGAWIACMLPSYQLQNPQHCHSQRGKPSGAAMVVPHACTASTLEAVSQLLQVAMLLASRAPCRVRIQQYPSKSKQHKKAREAKKEMEEGRTGVRTAPHTLPPINPLTSRAGETAPSLL